MNPEYGKGQEIAEIIEELLKIVADLARLEFKTPPHDIAAWVVREFKRRRGRGSTALTPKEPETGRG